MSGAIEALLARPPRREPKVGVVGILMGGGLALKLACDRADVVGACAPFYGLIPWEGALPDWVEAAGPGGMLPSSTASSGLPPSPSCRRRSTSSAGRAAQRSPRVQPRSSTITARGLAAAEAEVAWRR
ncbi:MAG: dienelactone hydrolase family protein [Actinobacteria bacterium]|nr:dienelactone hydrolase family protein [Actinomycetota bacterium]